jgi:hypothetical protein
MDYEKEALWDSTASAHSKIQMATFDLEDIAASIDYLHPKLADELMHLAKTIEHARKTIQGNHAELINMDLKRSQHFMGEVLDTLINNASK